jgi:hypothetical protein
MQQAGTARQIFVAGTVHARPISRVGWQVFLIAVLVGFLATAAKAQSATEYQVKAAFLFNFAKFVEWPPASFPDASAPLQICVLGRDPLGEELRNIASDKTVNGRKIEVHQVSDVLRARSCHILYIAPSGTVPVKQIVEGLHGASVLTVGDCKGFAEQGGMINFVLENDRVKFEVSSKAAEQVGLKISSKLLSVAKSVIV